ncbi:MAG: type IV pilus assembly protein PilM [Candidatus Levyibacteriota bacterium]
MKNKAFGLDIGVTSMKAVWLSRERAGFVLDSAVSAPTPSKGMFSESPLDQEEMARAIRNLVDEAKITTRYVNVALPEGQVYTRIIEMPILSDKELISAIYWEAEQYIPVPLPTITLDYKVLQKPQKPEEGEKMTVLLVGAPSNLLEKYEKVLSMGGFIITSIETEILASLRSTIIENSTPPTLLVNIGGLNTTLAIMRKGLLSFTYSVPTGGIALTRAIAANFGFTFTQAEEYKKIYGLSEQNSFGGKIGTATQPILNSLIAEIKKALAFYMERYKDDPIKQIVLSGGSAKLPGFTTYFAKTIGIETVVANPWKVLVSQEVPKEILDNAPEYTVSVGLAMRE